MCLLCSVFVECSNLNGAMSWSFVRFVILPPLFLPRFASCFLLSLWAGTELSVSTDCVVIVNQLNPQRVS